MNDVSKATDVRVRTSVPPQPFPAISRILSGAFQLLKEYFFTVVAVFAAAEIFVSLFAGWMRTAIAESPAMEWIISMEVGISVFEIVQFAPFAINEYGPRLIGLMALQIVIRWWTQAVPQTSRATPPKWPTVWLNSISTMLAMTALVVAVLTILNGMWFTLFRWAQFRILEIGMVPDNIEDITLLLRWTVASVNVSVVAIGLAYFALVLPVCVVEGVNIRSAMLRSSNLLSGYRVRIIVLALVATAVAFFLKIALYGVFDSIGGTASMSAIEWMDRIYPAVCSAVFGLLCISLYREVVRAKEGPPPDEIAERFS